MRLLYYLGLFIFWLNKKVHMFVGPCALYLIIKFGLEIDAQRFLTREIMGLTALAAGPPPPAAPSNYTFVLPTPPSGPKN